MQYTDNTKTISWVPMESMQSKESICAKKITMKQLMSHETLLHVTEDGCVKAVRIMTTVGENLVSTDKDTTCQPLQTVHQYTAWYRQASPWTYAPS
jgi:hypothetical protein